MTVEKITQYLTVPIYGDKLTWVRAVLNTHGVESRLKTSIKGVVLTLESDKIEMVFHLLNSPIGELFVGDDKTISYIDLPDNHPIFRELASSIEPQEQSNGPVRRYEDIDLFGIKLKMYEVESSNLSTIGFATDETDAGFVTVYIRFKGGQVYYRYRNISKEVCATIWNVMERKRAGEQEASVGSEVHWAIIDKADKGEIVCEKMDPTTGDWVLVPPKAERVKSIQKKYSTSTE